jgi:hypothetical protein
MKSIKQVLWILALCTSSLFFSKNASAQCSSFNVTASKTADGAFLGDVTVGASITGGNASTSFTWYTSGYSYIGFGATKANLSAGSFCVIASDSSSSPICKDTFCLTVTDTGTFNCANLQSAIWEADTCQIGDVNIYTSVWGGSGSYSYSWNTSSSDTLSYLLNKTTGMYSVIVTDKLHGCKDTIYKTVVDDTCNVCTSFSIGGYISENDNCQTNDINLGAQKWGGSSNYAYKWNTGDTVQSINNRTTGNYSVTITDRVTGCKDTLYLSVVDDTCNPCQNHQAYINKQDPCGKNDITLRAYPNSWSGKYKFLWSNGSTDSVLYNRGSGTYWVKVTDSILGCIDTAYLTMVDDTCNPCQNFRAWIVENDLCQKNDVHLTANQSNSIWSPRYTYKWNTGATTNSLSNRSAGNYWVIVKDSTYGCEDTAFITVVDDTCVYCDSLRFGGYIYEYYDSCAKNDASIYANVSSSSGVVKYLWNTGDTLNNLTNIGSGNYWVRIYDPIYGCIDTIHYTLADDTCGICDNFSVVISPYDGNTTNDISLYAYVFGGSGNYTYNWVGHSISIDNLNGRTTGTYKVKVIDLIYGCKDSATINVVDSTWTVSPCADFYPYIDVYDSCKNNDLRLGVYVYNQSNSVFQYQWDNGSQSQFIYNKPTGNYWVIVRDTVYGCIDTLYVYAVDTNYKCCYSSFYTEDQYYGATKSFNTYSSGGSGTAYNWNFGNGQTSTSSSPTHSYSTYGNYTVCLYSVDASGCKDTFCDIVYNPAPAKNLKVSHYGIPYIKDTNRYTYITYQNIGTTTENGTIEYKYPAGMTLISSTVSPLTHIGNKITFSVGSLVPGASGTIYLEMKTPMSFTLGSIKCDTAIILPITGDIVQSNNTSYECDSVVASWDPNDKTPNPKGIGSDGNIPSSTSEIGYLIRFENEGNWRTYRVRVEDEIDPSFDINSVMIGDVSHAFRLVRNGSKLIWYFDNIELTPKSVDPNRSHGYIQYTLQLKSGLALGTQLKNTAYIYFDANPAIITNTTKNTLKNADESASVRAMNADDLLDFNWRLNGDKLTVSSPSRMQAIRVYDISGKLLLDRAVNSDSYEVANTTVTSGIYIVHVEIDNQTVIKKIKF